MLIPQWLRPNLFGPQSAATSSEATHLAMSFARANFETATVQSGWFRTNDF